MGADRAAGGGQRSAGPAGLAAIALIDDSSRPRLEVSGPELSAIQRSRGQHLVQIHDMYRGELIRVQELLERVSRGEVPPADLRGMVAGLTMSRTYAALGAFCAQFCSAVDVHHRIEDAAVFPALRRASDRLAGVLDRLSEEHEAIAGLLSDLDSRVVAMVDDPAQLPTVRAALQRLADDLLSHLAYEEEQLVDPLGRFDVLL